MNEQWHVFTAPGRPTFYAKCTRIDAEVYTDMINSEMWADRYSFAPMCGRLSITVDSCARLSDTQDTQKERN